jgi:hypothetical protein
MRPQVDIALSNGGLNLQGPPAFGTVGILVASPVAPVAGFGVPFLIKSKNEAATAFAQVGNAAVLAVITDRFFAEASEGTAVYVMAMAQTTTLAVLLAAANADKLLTLANGAIRLLGVIKYPAVDYAPTITNGFDEDVHTAVIAAQTLADRWFLLKKPFRVLIEGFGFTNAGAAKDYSTDTKRNVAIVVGNINAGTADALCLVLGRASKASPQQNIGRVKSGSLSVPQADVLKLGAVLIENVPDSDLELLYDKRYMSFERNEIASGYVITDDNMLTALTDDYNSLANGRVIDNATRISFAVYYRELKDDVDVDEGGRLATVVEKALENAIESGLDQYMRGQLSTKKDGTSDVECLVNPDAIVYAPLYAANDIQNPNFNILQTGQVYLFLQLRPKGCLKYLLVYLGYVA